LIERYGADIRLPDLREELQSAAAGDNGMTAAWFGTSI
jgi:hypothetical protein